MLAVIPLISWRYVVTEARYFREHPVIISTALATESVHDDPVSYRNS